MRYILNYGIFYNSFIRKSYWLKKRHSFECLNLAGTGLEPATSGL